MARLTENDKQFWFITYGESNWNPWRVVFSTGGGCDEEEFNHLTFYAFGKVFRIPIPTKFKPYQVTREWESEGEQRFYTETFRKNYGFCLSDGFLQIFYGAQTHSDVDTKSKSWFLPWTQWRFVRATYYTPKFEVHYQDIASTKSQRRNTDWEKIESCPTVDFEIEDYDGEKIVASTKVIEREWRFGTGYFKWLSWFRKAKVIRSLDINFSSEVGPEKGSWKGGTIGHGIDMLPGETHESAMKRYCDQEHTARRSKNFKIKFLKKM